MEHVKRLGWFALAGFAASLGAAAAIAIVLVGVDYFSKNWKHPSPVQAMAPAEAVAITDVRIAELTTSGGIRGVATNRSPNTVSSMRVDLVLSRGADVLHRCEARVELDLKAGESSHFVGTCADLDPRKLTSDITPGVVVKSVFPGPLAQSR